MPQNLSPTIFLVGRGFLQNYRYLSRHILSVTAHKRHPAGKFFVMFSIPLPLSPFPCPRKNGSAGHLELDLWLHPPSRGMWAFGACEVGGAEVGGVLGPGCSRGSVCRWRWGEPCGFRLPRRGDLWARAAGVEDR